MDQALNAEHTIVFSAKVLQSTARMADWLPLCAERCIDVVITTVIILARLNLYLALDARLVVQSILLLLALARLMGCVVSTGRRWRGG